MNVPQHVLPLPESELEELAACLMTSSTLQRYLLCLDQSRAVHRLRDEIGVDRSRIRDLISQAFQCWHHVTRQRVRTAWELPLAVLMWCLRDRHPETIDLLISVALSRSPHTVWLTGLAKQILAVSRGATSIGQRAQYGVRLGETAAESATSETFQEVKRDFSSRSIAVWSDERQFVLEEAA